MQALGASVQGGKADARVPLLLSSRASVHACYHPTSQFASLPFPYPVPLPVFMLPPCLLAAHDVTWLTQYFVTRHSMFYIARRAPSPPTPHSTYTLFSMPPIHSPPFASHPCRTPSICPRTLASLLPRLLAPVFTPFAPASMHRRKDPLDLIL
jgi:hypothetical protein